MNRVFLFAVLAWTMVLRALAGDASPDLLMDADSKMPFDMPRKCMTKPRVTTINCACYLVVTGQITARMPGTAQKRCRGILGSIHDIIKLGNSCRRFVNANMEIMVNTLSKAVTAYVKACFDSDSAGDMLGLPPPMETPSPSFPLLSRMCMTRRFRNIIVCACYLLVTDQITAAGGSTRSNSLMMCRGILGPNRFLFRGATTCRKFIGGKTGRIMIKRLEFQINVYLKRCLNPDSPQIMFGIPV